jgi:hypothetical protein
MPQTNLGHKQERPLAGPLLWTPVAGHHGLPCRVHARYGAAGIVSPITSAVSSLMVSCNSAITALASATSYRSSVISASRYASIVRMLTVFEQEERELMYFTPPVRKRPRCRFRLKSPVVPG